MLVRRTRRAKSQDWKTLLVVANVGVFKMSKLHKKVTDSADKESAHINPDCDSKTNPADDVPYGTASAKAVKRNCKSPKADEQKQIRYTAKEKKIIPSIAEALRTVEKSSEIIGKLVDALVVEKGGIEYGGETIERIAAHPDINCSAQHLRKCWNLYRFTSAYGYMISTEHKKVCR